MNFKRILFYILFFYINLTKVFAGGLLDPLSDTEIRRGDIHAADIPNILGNAINFFFGIAGTIAIVFVIIGAYKILFGSLTQDKTKGKDTIVMAITGFVLAAMSWSIIQFILDNINL